MRFSVHTASQVAQFGWKQNCSGIGMAYSARFKAFEKRANSLRKQFMPATFSSTGNYTNQQLDNARAYRVLVHAEIEHFFEERVSEIADLAINLWKTRNKVSLPIACMLTNPGEMKMSLPNSLGTGITAQSLAGKIHTKFRSSVGNNHGIKIGNLLSLFLPVGILESDIDAGWISTIDGFGTQRGATAHSAHISYPINPQDDYNTVKQIIAGIKDIDVMLNKLRQSVR
jgi:hypothetical protein